MNRAAIESHLDRIAAALTDSRHLLDAGEWAELEAAVEDILTEAAALAEDVK